GCSRSHSRRSGGIYGVVVDGNPARTLLWCRGLDAALSVADAWIARVVASSNRHLYSGGRARRSRLRLVRHGVDRSRPISGLVHSAEYHRAPTILVCRLHAQLSLPRRSFIHSLGVDFSLGL